METTNPRVLCRNARGRALFVSGEGVRDDVGEDLTEAALLELEWPSCPEDISMVER